MDDGGRGVADGGPDGVGVEQVDVQAGGAGQLDHSVALLRAEVGQMASGKARGSADEDAPAQAQSAGPTATRWSAEPWPLEATAASSIGAGVSVGGFRRRSSSPSTKPNSAS